MLRLAIVGATGRTGTEIVKQALEAGHAVKALHRGSMPSTTSGRLRWIVGDIDDADTLRQLVEDVDVVISAIGPRPGRLSDTCSTASAALIAAGARRLVVVSGMALDLPGDQKGFVDRIAARIVRALSPEVFADKVKEIALLQSSSIDWTALRVGMLMNGAEPKPVRASLRKPQGQSINCGSLARFALEVAADGSFSRQAPFVSN